MAVSGSNAGEFFDIFMHIFHPVVTVLLEYLDPTIYNCLVFAF